MAAPRIFLSSTCYDLSVIRTQIRTFIQSLGYHPVLSEFHDVLFDPNQHTHSSCLGELPNCDAVVLIIGSRSGGIAVADAVSQIDFAKLAEYFKQGSLDAHITDPSKLTVTQLEILKAIELGIPVYTFIDTLVSSDHHLYETNKNEEFVEKIKFPSIEKPETAKYIFEFISLLRKKVQGNTILNFSGYKDIEDALRAQWAGLFQRLLTERRESIKDNRQMEHMTKQFEDLKSAILVSIPDKKVKDIAKSVVNYRRLIGFLLSIPDLKNEHLLQDFSFDELLRQAEIVGSDVKTVHDRNIPRVCLLLGDIGYYETRVTQPLFQRIETEWESFRMLDVETRKIVIETANDLGDQNRIGMKYRLGDFYEEKRSSEAFDAFDALIDSAPEVESLED